MVEGALVARWRMRRDIGRCVVVSTAGCCWPLWAGVVIDVALKAWQTTWPCLMSKWELATGGCFVSGQQAGTLSFAVPRSPRCRTDPIPMSSRDSRDCPPAPFIRSSFFSVSLARYRDLLSACCRVSLSINCCVLSQLAAALSLDRCSAKLLPREAPHLANTPTSTIFD